jgi:adenine-specific DNA-methyltransferase
VSAVDDFVRLHGAESIIESLVDDIISQKAKHPSADTTALENRIDELVYKLYDLTYDEVKVIDPDFWLSEGEYERVRAE